jgi:4-alpha-glucanotransferase
MNQRGSGILLHITSLPSPFGIGDLGPEAFRLVDFLARAQQSYWQVLPLTPTDQGSGNSPYSSISSFAGNTALISPERLQEDGYLTPEDLASRPCFSAGQCDYALVIPFKKTLLDRAYERFKTHPAKKEGFEAFCQNQAAWLDDFALFGILKIRHQGRPWNEWNKKLRDRDPQELDNVKTVLHDDLEREKFFQYLFFSQWTRLKNYCCEKGVQLIGDLPIYVNYDSSDVWSCPKLFNLDSEKTPLTVAGVPPDYFSQTGQLWGNPTYRWDRLQETGFQWWFRRIGHHLDLFDILRLDHFRGFVGFWEVPVSETTAVNGRWVKAPAGLFFSALLERFPGISLIAEDLGIITADVKEVIHRFGFPGMRILLFAFDEDLPGHPYLPHNFIPNCVVYTGTHDNNTVRGWWDQEARDETRRRFIRYLGHRVAAEDISGAFIRLAMMSVAHTAIIPLQDLLGLGQEARMNIPSTAQGNWRWRLLPGQLTDRHEATLREMTVTYGRGSSEGKIGNSKSEMRNNL